MSAEAKSAENKRMQKLELTWVGKRCEFDKTDYALNIVAAPAEEEEE